MYNSLYRALDARLVVAVGVPFVILTHQVTPYTTTSVILHYTSLVKIIQISMLIANTIHIDAGKKKKISDIFRISYRICMINLKALIRKNHIDLSLFVFGCKPHSFKMMKAFY